jgi:peptidoglycan/xylan/chitin deacetylase (PgdA/CDA1 family)
MTAAFTFVVKRAVAYGLYALGILHLWCRVAFRHRAVVLTYHRVLPDEALDTTWSHPGIVVRRETFDRHVRVLKRLFHIVTLDEFVAHVREHRPFRRPSCLITFDDGWRDTYEEAWPLLKQHGVPAVVFLPSSLIGSTRTFWREELSALLYRAWQEAQTDPSVPARLEDTVAWPGLASCLTSDRVHVRECIRGVVDALKTASGGGRASALPVRDPRELVSAMKDALGHPADLAHRDGFMTWDHAREMASDGVAFGGHGVTHRILTRLVAEDAREEIRNSRAALARELGSPVLAFSYPNGDWNAELASSVRETGFQVAFSTVSGAVACHDRRFALRRINIHEGVGSSTPMLMGRLVGLL